MTKLRVVVLLAVVALLLFPAVASAQGGLELPCRFYGAVSVDGVDVEDGTVITATVAGDTYQAVVPAVYGPSTYELKIEPPEGTRYDEGAVVAFKIGDLPAGQSSWEAGGNIEFNLELGEAAPEGGSIRFVTVNMIPSGQTASATYDSATGTLTLNIPEGEGVPGPKGDTGDTGAVGPQGSSGSLVIAIVAIVLAVIAVGMGAMTLRRRV